MLRAKARWIRTARLCQKKKKMLKMGFRKVKAYVEIHNRGIKKGCLKQNKGKKKEIPKSCTVECGPGSCSAGSALRHQTHKCKLPLAFHSRVTTPLTSETGASARPYRVPFCVVETNKDGLGLRNEGRRLMAVRYRMKYREG